MKICFTAKGKEISAPMEESFGRSPYFLFYETSSGEVETLKNPYLESQGAGIKVASLVAEKGARVVVTGRVGPKAREALKRLGIQVITGSWPSIEEALRTGNLGEIS